MSRGSAIFGTILFLLVAPGSLAGLVPWAISGWHLTPPFFGLEPVRWLGVALIVAGLPALLDSFARFALQGFGTPAPILPTERLIATGLYRHVRNPMYVGVVATVLGQALLLGSVALVAYAAILFLCFHIFVIAYEEPACARRFGADFTAYRAAVPRWLPRLTPHRGAQ